MPDRKTHPDIRMGGVQRRRLLFLLAAFYGIVDLRNYRKYAFPLLVIGANSIAAYLMAETLPGFIGSSFSIHLGVGFD